MILLIFSMIGAAFASGAQADCPETFASEVVDYTPGPGVEPDYAQPRNALGAPDFDEGRNAVSLGNRTADDAVLTVRFDRPIANGKGVDLYVYERGPSAEPTWLDVSEDGTTWVRVGRISGAVRGVDLAKTPAAKGSWRFLRLTGVRDGAAGPWAGPDIDAIGLKSCAAGKPNS